MRFLIAAVLSSILSTASGAEGTGEGEKPPPIADSEVKALVARVRADWRAQDGETIDEIISKTTNVAHFIPRTWDVAQTIDGSSKSVVLSWVKRPQDKEGDEYTIGWDINQDGSLTLGPPYAKTMELGWQALALSLIQSEANDGDQDTNRRFLHDLRNLNFVETSEGRLGDLLTTGRCSLGDPVGVDYLDSWGRDKEEKGDFWRLQISVDCELSGPRYFTHDGIILFMKHGIEAWRPYSFFAHRIATFAPGSWFTTPDPVEKQAFAVATAIAKRNGMASSQEDIDALVKTVELRNDGTMIRW